MNLSGSSDGRYNYISTELDAETGPYDMHARYYDPWSGRFEAVDPLSDFYPTQSPYSYSFDSPERFLDPSGWDPQNGNLNWQFSMNGTINFFNNSGTLFSLPAPDLNNSVKIKLRAPQQAYLSLLGQIEYTEHVAHWI